MPENYDLQEYNFQIEQVKAHHNKKYEHIKLAVEALEASNYPRPDIRRKVTKDLEGFVTEQYIREVCADLGLTDQRFNPHDAEIKEVALNSQASGGSTIIADMDGDKAEEVRKSLPNNSSTPKAPKPTCSKCGKEGVKDENDHCCTCGFAEGKPRYHDANADYIHHVVKLINFWKAVKMKVSLIAFKEKIDPADYDEWMRVSDGALDFADQAWDERNIVPVPYQFKLAEFVNASTIKNGAKMFLGWVKEYSKISSKQVTKILLGKTREVDSYYEPTDEISAKESNFYGEKCPKCGSFRVKWEFGWCHCYACEAEYPVKPRRLGKFKDKEEGAGDE